MSVATILVVDDSKLARVIARRALSRAGYDTLEAQNGHEGLQMALEHKPDCIVTDLLMPEMDGLQFLLAMREQGLQTPVVVVTANIQKVIREECMSSGAFDVINKPEGQGDVFLQIVADALNSRHEGG